MALTTGPSVDLSTSALSQPRSVWAPSLPLVLGLVMFLGLNSSNGLPLLSDPDTHWHIAVGDWILAQLAVPTTDSFSFTFAGQPWIAKEWLSQVVMALAFDLAGWGGVTALAAAAFAATFALMLRLLLRDIAPLPALLFTLAAVVMTAPHFLARPFVFALPLALIWMDGLVRAVEERRAPEPGLLLVMLLWANMHGGFTLGLVLAGAFALEALVTAQDGAERRAQFIAWAKFGLGALLVACVTPYGPESILVTLRIFGLGEALGLIAEWRSPDFQNQRAQELVLLIALYLALSRGVKLPLIRVLVVIGLLHMFLSHARNAELLALLAPLAVAPVLARQFPAVAADPDAVGRLNGLARPAGRAAVALFVAVGGIMAAIVTGLGGVAPPAANMPAGAVAFAREAGLEGRVFNFYGYGGYLIREGVPTYIDGRGELFGGPFIKRYVEASNLRGEESFETLLKREHIDWTLLPRLQPANQLLARLPGWRRAYEDDEAMIFVRERNGR
ncbi:MAG: hypothetical protein FJX11_08335 [Alphaproteobacteria bacterium]|nr:hypothetical protein [Alphaproteobacteria bacterium]